MKSFLETRERKILRKIYSPTKINTAGESELIMYSRLCAVNQILQQQRNKKTKMGWSSGNNV
jgi:hypothetical protein